MSESRGCPTRDPLPSGGLPPPQQGDTATHFVKGVHYRSPHVEEELLTGGATQHPHRGMSGLPLTGLAACLTKLHLTLSPLRRRCTKPCTLRQELNKDKGVDLGCCRNRMALNPTARFTE